MAYSKQLLIAVFVVATASSIAYAGLLDGILGNHQVQSTSLLGQLFCSADGSAVPGSITPGLANANVSISCNGGALDLGHLLTNEQGIFQGVLTSNVPFSPSSCVGQVGLPFLGCSALPTDGILQIAFNLLGLLNLQGILGIVASLVGTATKIISL